MEPAMSEPPDDDDDDHDETGGFTPASSTEAKWGVIAVLVVLAICIALNFIFPHWRPK
jgi:hypothetical protein